MSAPFAKALIDGAVVAKRNLIKIKRVPDLLVFSTLSPIMFILLFAYIFGSAISGTGTSYREFLIPGIFAQTVIFGATITGAGMADDIQKGIIDRFRSLPMSRSAVLVGRTTSDLLNNCLVVVIMSVDRSDHRLANPRRRARRDRRRILLLLAFAYAMSWVMALRRPDRADARGREQRLVHGDLPADVHRQYVRPDDELPGRAEGDRQLESGLVGHRGRARTVRQHRRHARPCRTRGRWSMPRCTRCSGRSRWLRCSCRSACGGTRRPPHAERVYRATSGSTCRAGRAPRHPVRR